jgi:LysR family glycine cleavage system transcriptional activator
VTRLPPFFALRALEAAARHRSYTRAAKELAVTHGAVSQQIRRLESELEARLFQRRGNVMEPSPEAQRLAAEVRRALDLLSNALSEFAAAAEHDPLRVSLDPRFAGRWLAPRLNRLLASSAGTNLDLRVEERFADFVTDGVDMAVRYGAGGWEGVLSAHLFTERLYVVCSPAFAEKHRIDSPADLLSVTLLHQRHRPWSLWFRAFGLEAPEPKGTIFDDSLMLLAAAENGMGVALARSGLIQEELRQGRLVRPIETGVDSDLGFFAVWRPDARKIRRIEALRDWLLQETAPARAAAQARLTLRSAQRLHPC